MTLRCHYRGFWSVNSALGGRSPASSKRLRIWITDIRHFASSEHACTPISRYACRARRGTRSLIRGTNMPARPDENIAARARAGALPQRRA